MNTNINKKDEIIMRLVHYFVTEEDYQPIIVNGVKNEIWLENLDAPYKVIRINSNYIHNDDQLKFDTFRIKNVIKQIKKKTFSFKIKTLNILLDLNDDIELNNGKDIDNYKIKSLKDVRKDDGLAGLFPKLKTMTLNNGEGLEAILNLTSDISIKNEKDNAEYEKIFKQKKIIINNILIFINIVMFILSIIDNKILNMFVLSPSLVKSGEYYRLFTSLFLHGSVVHFVCNMYALHIIGREVENYLGKWKYVLIYFFSGLTGSLLSCLTSYSSLGASGAIFGLLGSLLYFGYHYRLYFGNVILKQVIPVVVINLLIGFTFSNINNIAHIGGLIGGLFITMALGVNNKKNNSINGLIISLIYLMFLLYIVFFAK